MNKEEFLSLTEQNGLSINQKMLEQLDKYRELLKKYNQVMNLTSIVEEEEVYEKHYYDSLMFTFGMNLDDKRLIDVGTGAGFPGLVLAICFPKLKVDLLEPLTKRCNFLNEVIAELDLKNVIVINERAEDYSKKNVEKYDIATARAVAKLNILLEISSQMIKVGGFFIALKGRIAEEEIQEAKNAIKVLRFDLKNVQKSFLPSQEDVRMNVFLLKENKTPSSYPRNFGQIKKRPL